MTQFFDKIIIIGYGIVTKNVLETVYSKRRDYKYEVEYIEHEVYPINSAVKYAVLNNDEFVTIEREDELLGHLLEESVEHKLLIISAGNNYDFPRKLVEKDNVTIVNYHNSLLPNYPGRNAVSWVIFNKEEKTGITWHYVSETIEPSDIIAQREYVIPDDIKAYQLSEELMKLASDTFQSVYENILNGRADRKTQSNNTCNRKEIKSNEVPANGNVNLSDDVSDIYRILRALDFGKDRVFPLMIADYQGTKIQIKNYRIASEKENGEYKLCIPYDNRILIIYFNVLISDTEMCGEISIDELSEIVGALKRVNKRIATNMYLTENELRQIIQKEEIAFYYRRDICLNLYRKEWNFTRLYYYIADYSQYCVYGTFAPIVADIFFTKRTERTEKLVDAFVHNGFKEYAFFSRYVKKSDEIDVMKRDSNCIIDGTAPEFYEILKKCFDVYTDYIPEERNIDEFIRDHMCYSYIDENGDLLGGAVITIRGEVATEEFTFVKPGQRGRGISKELHAYCYRHASDYGTKQITKFYSWVNDKNESSWKHLIHVGYRKDNMHKITMMKG
ncbi:MAG: GNAT family N-acetyltransferase [Lachnospiraceae bacterium]|nr:GNAT family N-acetyltransferase [Lachnospiraceae bacterium]